MFYEKIQHKFFVLSLFILLTGFLFNLSAPHTHASQLELSPTRGTYEVGDTFTVFVYANTEGKRINAIDARISFTPNTLQLISPGSGKSVIEIWTAQPSFNNRTGKVYFQGAIPGGVEDSKALVSELTFRVSGVGTGIITFDDGSEILLHDGNGTPALEDTTSASYTLILPLSNGPTVRSESHPDQTQWHNISDVALSWSETSPSARYSYVLDSEPGTLPDEIAEGSQNSVTYSDLGDGTHYFHIRESINGRWGGASHYALNIDTSPPAQFPVDIFPSERTSATNPTIQFNTTDAHSGIDRYEIAVFPLSPSENTESARAEGRNGDNPLFIEAQTPYVLKNLDYGSYDVRVRSYDLAGNMSEQTQRLDVVRSYLTLVSDGGLIIRDTLTISWTWLFILFLLLFVSLLYIAVRIVKWSSHLHTSSPRDSMPEYLKKQIQEFKGYKDKYTNLLFALLIPASIFFLFSPTVSAQEEAFQTPPLITTYSEHITNKDLFYIGGETDIPGQEITIYRKNTDTGEAFSTHITSSDDGNWFYRHDDFLKAGEYVLWVQGGEGDTISPPSPQVVINVEDKVFNVGLTRISHEALYLSLLIFITLVLLLLILYIVHHSVKGHRRKRTLHKEIDDVKHSVRVGFALLQKEIEEKIATHENEGNDEIVQELKEDLEKIRKRIGKEIKDIEIFGEE